MLAKAIREELHKAGYSQQDVIAFANEILDFVAKELRSYDMDMGTRSPDPSA